MSIIDLDPSRPRRLLVGGSPEGHDARLLADLARRCSGDVLHVALDDARAARIAQALAFFAPEMPIVQFPAWDCLPYDRVSPNPEVVGRRVDALTRLAAARASRAPRIVITTVNALVQRVSPRSAFAGSTFTARPGDRIDMAHLQAFLSRNGYTRAQTVREPGEYAIRGGIIDLFPPSAEEAEAVRLDLFGDELEQVRSFDPISQRTTGKPNRVDLRPMSEVFLDKDSIARFRSGYRELFGAVNDDDPLYEAISAGRKQAGMEHWLPLFHEGVETLFDYLPDAVVTLDHQAEEARDTRLTQIADFYEARRTMQDVERRSNGTIYKPLPPDRLYLDADEWDRLLGGRAVAAFSPFGAPTEGEAMADAGGRRGRDFADARAKPDVNVFEELREHIAGLKQDGRRVVIAGYTVGARERLRTVLAEHGVAEVEPVETWAEARRLDAPSVAAAVLPIENGFVADDLAVIAEQDIFGDRLARPARKRRRSDQFIAEVSSLTPGDFVVHVDHGIGRYDGIETLTVSGAPHDCLRVIYAGDDKLFVPVENIEVLSRYGSEEGGGQLDKLGGAGWQARKARVKKRLKDMADELMRIAASRELKRADPLAASEGLYQEFAARFPFPETEDQLRAIEDVLDDLQSGKPMDRLVCGDVGFGKTEVALRAAFVAAMAGVQVAVVVPTTLLARQHFKTFSARFKNLPIKVAQLSRMVAAKETKEVKQGLADGSIDIVVGTHAVLGKTITFKNLGLVVVDEEQHFGVKQKERLKSLRQDVHVLTMTATPIPRTLQLALSGVRELSIIATPPVDRLAVRTFVLPYDPVIIREAIMREHFRGGQTYYVCPRIEDLSKVHQRLKELVPEVKIVEAHGRMASSQMEEIMTAFYDGQFDVLLSTTIVESGLDVPSANTMILHRADMFGLAQLYQLRGRIGRSKLRGYAYLTYAPRTALSETAQRRLHVIETLDSLGAGFSLASHDMDIRGAGNLLGEEQSGHIREVGVELYQQMLEEAVAAVRGGALPGGEVDHWVPQINLGLPVMIPEDYVADLNVRLDLYRRIARLVDRAEIDAFAAELIDRFGKLPAEVENLLSLIALKRLCRDVGVEKLEAGPKGVVIAFRNNKFERPERLVEFISKQAGSVKLRPDHKLVCIRSWDSAAMRVQGVQRLMQDLIAIAA
ncbi:MAG TPA: transcription-repair coupling factor, partial [Alphaproteobacteria bacterium]|nr:transcription-repair coupling factor [Alphaproteobacteria bacterium]